MLLFNNFETFATQFYTVNSTLNYYLEQKKRTSDLTGSPCSVGTVTIGHFLLWLTIEKTEMLIESKISKK